MFGVMPMAHNPLEGEHEFIAEPLPPRDSLSNESTLHTLDDFELGDPSPTRHILLAFDETNNSRYVAEASIDDIPATMLRRFSSTSSRSNSIWIVKVPEGGVGTLRVRYVAAYALTLSPAKLTGAHEVYQVRGGCNDSSSTTSRTYAATVGDDEIAFGSVGIAASRAAEFTAGTSLSTAQNASRGRTSALGYRDTTGNLTCSWTVSAAASICGVVLGRVVS